MSYYEMAPRSVDDPKPSNEESEYEDLADYKIGDNNENVRNPLCDEEIQKQPKPRSRGALSCCLTTGRYTYSFCHCVLLVAFVLFVLFIAIPLLFFLIFGGVFFLAVMESAKTVLPEILNRTMIVLEERSNSSSFWTSPERWNFTEFDENFNSSSFWTDS